MAKHTFFITGTDTDVGKTYVSTLLLKKWAQQGASTVALKPVAAGCDKTDDGLRNDDALQLMDAATKDLLYEQVNPIRLEAAIAPHIAAQQERKIVSADRLVGVCRGVMMQSVDVVLIEGAGGWMVPLNQSEMLSQVPRDLQVPVVLVVAMRLGCLNHALLTVQAIQQSGVRLAGWVANVLNPDMPVLNENIQTLEQRIPAPLLGVVPFGGDEREAINSVNVDLLTGK